jgi:hypothetical protein
LNVDTEDLRRPIAVRELHPGFVARVLRQEEQHAAVDGSTR